jgi:AcrR family transcriptional regulator
MTQPPPAPRTRDSEAAKARLLQAATDEFAAYGIAGARIDRIGAAAQVNKAQIYTYFGNKDQLFDIIMDTHVARILDQVPFTPEDLPGYSGQLFDFLIANPHQLRLATWNRLERTGDSPGPAQLATSMRQKTEAIARSQADGHLPETFTAEDLLTFVLALASAWTPASAVTPTGQDADALASHRGAVIEAVRRLVADHDNPAQRPAAD